MITLTVSLLIMGTMFTLPFILGAITSDESTEYKFLGIIPINSNKEQIIVEQELKNIFKNN